MTTLLAYAFAREGESLAGRPELRTLRLGVGKVAATMTMSAALAERRPDAVLLFGVCGAYPARHLRPGLAELQVLDRCMVASEQLIDEGVQTPEGFLDLEQLKLGEVGPFVADPDLSGRIAAVLDCPLVSGATVSTCAGLDHLSHAYALRSGAQIENMEGAAVAAVCRRFGVPFAELRVVSNRTGDRDQGGWALEPALARLGSALEQVLAAKVLP